MSGHPPKAGLRHGSGHRLIETRLSPSPHRHPLVRETSQCPGCDEPQGEQKGLAARHLQGGSGPGGSRGSSRAEWKAG